MTLLAQACGEATSATGQMPAVARLEPPSGLLDELVARVRAAGISKVLTVIDQQSANTLEAIAATLHGAIDGGGEAEFASMRHDMNPENVDMRWYERPFNPTAVKNMEHELTNGVAQAGANVSGRFQQLMEHPNVVPRYVTESYDSQWGIRHFLRHPSFSVVATYFTHACGLLEELSSRNVPWLGATLDIHPYPLSPRAVMVVTRDVATRDDDTNFGYVSQNGAAVRTGPKQYFDYLISQSLVVVLVPLHEGVEATIVVPASMLATVRQFADEHDGEVTIVTSDLLRDAPEEWNQFIFWMTTTACIVGAAALQDRKCIADRTGPQDEAVSKEPAGKVMRAKPVAKAIARATRLERELPPFTGKPVSSQAVSLAAPRPPGPGDIAAEVTEQIRACQADKDKATLRKYLNGMGKQFLAALDPVSGGGAAAAADAAFRMAGVVRSSPFNHLQLARWFQDESYMNGVNFDFVFQTVKDYRQLNPEDENLAKAAAMLQELSRLARMLERVVDPKGRQGPAVNARPDFMKKKAAPQGANASGAAAPITPPQNVAAIYQFAKQLVAEPVPDGENLNAVRLGTDIFIPSAVIVPHWHVNPNFVVYKHGDANHVEVGRGDYLYPARAASVGMRLVDGISRDDKIRRMQTFILTGQQTL
ncbi:MAG: hypothetical protein K0Q43_3512 [Ramlibacter sp.]|nr:hypothetical protein [Ramlibacter sp.]